MIFFFENKGEARGHVGLDIGQAAAGQNGTAISGPDQERRLQHHPGRATLFLDLRHLARASKEVDSTVHREPASRANRESTIGQPRVTARNARAA